MYELFIGNHERVMGNKVYYKSIEEFIVGRVVYYSFKSKKYTLKLESGKTIYTEKIYLKR